MWEEDDKQGPHFPVAIRHIRANIEIHSPVIINNTAC